MISGSCFAEIRENAIKLKYTSFEYIDYDDCKHSDIIFNDKKRMILLDASNSPARIHFAADDFETIIEAVSRLDSSLAHVAIEIKIPAVIGSVKFALFLAAK